MIIEKVILLDKYNLEELLEESMSQGHKFIQKLVNEYIDGTNRFNMPGECLYIAFKNENIVGVGGLNIDPYQDQADVGRVRHLYVLSKYRGTGVGKTILNMIIEEARKSFRSLTLYTDNPIAHQMYINSGFENAEGIYKASHMMNLRRGN